MILLPGAVSLVNDLSVFLNPELLSCINWVPPTHVMCGWALSADVLLRICSLIFTHENVCSFLYGVRYTDMLNSQRLPEGILSSPRPPQSQVVEIAGVPCPLEIWENAPARLSL